MGIKNLTRLIADNAPEAISYRKIGTLTGRKVAIDASMSIYQFMIAVRPGQDGSMFTDSQGRETSHLLGMMYRTIRLMTNGIKPLYVFDGKPPEMKSSELEKRREVRAKAEAELKKAEEEGNVENIEKFSKRTLRVTPQHHEECRQLLTLMGVPWIVAPSEAEATCAAMARAGIVYGAGSEDTDTLTFGSPLLLRNLTASASRKLDIMEIDLGRVLQGLDITMPMFVDLCILCGCDYADSIRGIGPVRALALIRKHKNIETILEHLDPSKYKVPEDWPYERARELFLTPEVSTDEEMAAVSWSGSVDEDGLRAFLVEDRGFDPSRVNKCIEKLKSTKGKSVQMHMDSFFGRPTIIVNPNKKRKRGKKKGKGKGRKGGSKRPRR